MLSSVKSVSTPSPVEISDDEVTRLDSTDSGNQSTTETKHILTALPPIDDLMDIPSPLENTGTNHTSPALPSTEGIPSMAPSIKRIHIGSTDSGVVPNTVSAPTPDTPHLNISIPTSGLLSRELLEDCQIASGDEGALERVLQIDSDLMVSLEDDVEDVDHLPNPYENLEDPPAVQYYSPMFIDTPLETLASDSDEAVNRRFPSILRPGNPRAFDTPGSRRASMAVLGDFDLERPRPSFAVSERNIRRSFASEGDRYEAYQTWEDPGTYSSPLKISGYSSSPDENLLEHDDENTPPWDKKRAPHVSTTAELTSSPRPKVPRTPTSIWPGKFSLKSKPSKWKFWSKRQKNSK